MACALRLDKFGGRKCTRICATVWVYMHPSLQQCQLVTPLQLYFSFKAAFTNAQVRATSWLPSLPGPDASPAMACFHDILLLWKHLPRLCLPHVLLVRPPLSPTSPSAAPLMARYRSMRYSRMLEESSFANRKADYFWMLFLSSLMLLVSAFRRDRITAPPAPHPRPPRPNARSSSHASSSLRS